MIALRALACLAGLGQGWFNELMTLSTESTLLLRNTRLVLPDKVIAAASLLVAGGYIAKIFSGEPETRTAGAIEYDLAGTTVFPGFIDAHIHGAVGVDTMEATPEDLCQVSRFLVTQGVTAWLPTLVPAAPEQYEQSISSIASAIRQQGEESKPGARILGVHYEGPYVNSEQCGALHRECFRTFSTSTELDTLPTLSGADSVQMMTLAPEIDGGLELVRELCGRGWVVSIGHTRADVALLDQALEAGARHMTHFMNAMPSLHHRAPGPIGWGLLRDEVTCDVIADGIHLDPLTLRLLRKTKTAVRLSLISDAIAAAGMGDGDYQIWGETISVSGRRTRNSHGSIAGSVITMLDAVRMMSSLGSSEIEVARMASTNPARLLRLDADCGSIEPGKRADLVAIDQEGKVRLTLVKGLVAYSSKEAW